MQKKIELTIRKIDELSRQKPIKIISHFDTDGITSAAIFTRALQRWNKRFSLEIVKSLDEEYIKKLSDNQVIIFLDLASNSLHHLKEKNTEIFIFDHHEVTQEIPQNITLINPLIDNHESIPTAGICYIFAKTLSVQNKDLASLSVIGLVGDLLEKEIGRTYNEIIKDSETIIKKGLLLYPSTKPLDRALEYCSNPYIPGVTGSYAGCIELLREANIQRTQEKYKSLYELTEQEMSSLITTVMIRCANRKSNEAIIGNLFLVKWFNKLEDAREISALINACSRMDHPDAALGFCLGNKQKKLEAEKIYIEYKTHLISALRYISQTEKISGRQYAIINAKDNIKDTIIGTITSIISHSPVYEEGTIIVGLAYNEDKIKVSARIVGKCGKNVRDVLHKIVVPLGGEVGGHPEAAGCLIQKTHEQTFIEELKKALEVEVVKI